MENVGHQMDIVLRRERLQRKQKMVEINAQFSQKRNDALGIVKVGKLPAIVRILYIIIHKSKKTQF